MHVIVQATGALVACAALALVAWPGLLRPAVRRFTTWPGILAASAFRILLGIAFLVAAPGVRGTVLIGAMGGFLVLAGIALPLIGRERVERVAARGLSLPPALVRLWALGAVFLGVALFLAGSRA
ncbi:MAG: hypothetical protein R6X22_06240 [Gemmatimonadota bacterium]